MVPDQSLIERIDNLPTPSPVLSHIIKIIGSKESSASDIVEALKLDPAISSRALKVANSAYIGVPRRISSLQNAVVLLGTKRIQSMVIAAKMLGTMRLGASLFFTIENFWKHSVTVAFIAESIAKHIRRYEAVDPEDAFSAGLLHDAGKLLQGGLDPAMANDIYRRAKNSRVPYYRAEPESRAHTVLAGLIFERWNFPDELLSAVRSHHAPPGDTPHCHPAVLVHAADCMAHICGYGLTVEETAPVIESYALERIHLPLERLSVIARAALENQKRIEELVESYRQ